jgi:Ribbon-helix-helix domain
LLEPYGLSRIGLLTSEAPNQTSEAVKSAVWKRSIVIAGHRTSVSLGDEFWKSLKEIAADRDMTLQELVAAIDGNREHANLSSVSFYFFIFNQLGPDPTEPRYLSHIPWALRLLSSAARLKCSPCSCFKLSRVWS